MILLVSILLLFSTSLAVFLLYMHAKRKSARDIRLVELLFVVNFLYIFGYAMELASQTVSWKLVFNHVQYIGLPFIIPLWLLICVRFCAKEYRWSILKTIALLIIPAATLVLNMTYPLNGLLYSSYQVENWNHLDVVVFQKGIWYYVVAIWNFILSAITVWLYIRTYLKAERIRRKQALVLLLLSAFAFLFASSTFLSRDTSPIDFIVLLLSVSCVLLFTTLFKYSLFDLIPLAYSQLFNGMDYPVLVLADSMSVVKANAAAMRIFPRLREQSDVALQSLFVDDEKLISKLMESEESLVEVSMNAIKRFYSAKITRLNIKQSAINKDYGYLLVLSDVTSHINLVHDLEHEASMDPLTGLLNRRMFFPMAEKVIDQAAVAGEAVSLIMIDIDHFKKVNDEHGHQAGDAVLKEVSRIICSQVREGDIVGRYGGEEFLILLPSTNPKEAKAAAGRICSAVRQHDFNIEDRITHLTISIGVSSIKESESQRLDNLIYLADKALYDAKTKGRDRVCFRNEA